MGKVYFIQMQNFSVVVHDVAVCYIIILMACYLFFTCKLSEEIYCPLSFWRKAGGHSILFSLVHVCMVRSPLDNVRQALPCVRNF